MNLHVATGNNAVCIETFHPLSTHKWYADYLQSLLICADSWGMSVVHKMNWKEEQELV